MVADDVAHAVGKNLSTAAGKRIHTRGFQLLQRFADRELRAPRQIRDLDHGERLEMDLRKALLEARAEIEEILKRQVGMQSADDVEFRDRLGVSRGRGFECFVERHRVSAGRVFLSSKGAEAAGGHANIRGIDMAVDVEVRLVAVHALTHQVGHPAHGENVAGAVQGQCVIDIEALPCQHFVVDRAEPCVVRLKGMRLEGVV